MSRSTLGIPDDVVAMLSTVDSLQCQQPVWTFSKHQNGYSLKLFWKSKALETSPFNAPSVSFGRKYRSRQRMNAFLAKKSKPCHPSTPDTSTARVETATLTDQPVALLAKAKPLVPVTAEPNTVESNSSSQSSLSGDNSRACDASAPAALAASAKGQVQSEPPSTVSPIANRTRSREHQRSHVESVDSSVATGQPVEHCTEGSIESGQLLLHIPEDVHGVIKHHEDFVKCDELAAAEMVKECMKSQWSDRVKPGLRVKIKANNELHSGIVEECSYVSKLSYDCYYYYTTAKANVRIFDGSAPGSIKEIQFRDLIL